MALVPLPLPRVRQTSELSYREQGYDAEASMTPEELVRLYTDLARLNEEYEAKFGLRLMPPVPRILISLPG